MSYNVDEDFIKYLKSIPLEDRLEYVKQVCSADDMGDFYLALELHNYSKEEFLSE